MSDVVIGLIFLGIWIYCIFEVIASDASSVRNLPKLAWLVIVVLLGPIGALAWLFLGRPRGEGAYGASAVTGSLRRSGRRETDEDDPAAIQARIEARERMMKQWAEEDRRRSSGEPPDGHA